jgi:hypothetical protein
MIGSLLYLCASRPDIILSVCMCARFQVDPKEVHLRAVKRILRYLVYTPKFGLWYPMGSTFDLIRYSDADWAGCKIDRKSTLGTCQFLGRSLVSWASKKQNFVALSTAEAEYIVAGHCCAQLLWMRQTLRDYGYKLTKVPLLCDNESAIRMADNPVEHSRTKHIAIRYHFLRDHQQRGDIEIAYVSTKEQLANIFTKLLDEKTFTKLRHELNVGAKAKTPPFARCLRRNRRTNGDKTVGRFTLRPIRHRMKTCDEVVLSCDLVQHGGPRVIRPIVTGPAWPLRITGLICKGILVITVCNPALWEYSGDNLGV